MTGVRRGRGRSRTVLLALGAALAAFAVLLAGCGDDDDGGATASGADGDQSALVISAATSLKRAFEQYAPEAKLQFAGSDELAAQIRQGVRPDLFASANTRLPDELHAEGLVERPVVFAANRLVIAVPADGSEISSVEDLARSGTTIAIGSASVPIGAYTRTVLERLGARESAEILANVRSEEPDVGGVVGKVAQCAVDAGLVYVTDVEGAGGRLRAIELPAAVQPSVAYGVAVVRGAEHPEAARRFIDGLLDGAGAEALRAAGFEPPPGG